MLNDTLRDALKLLSDELTANASLSDALYANWRSGRFTPAASELSAEIVALAEQVDAELTEWTATAPTVSECADVLGDEAGEMVFQWCSASTANSDAHMFELLSAAAKLDAFREHTVDLVRARVVEGPLRDALACLPLIGRGDVLRDAANVEARARVEILIWEAGAAALQLPMLGRFIWNDEQTFEVMVAKPARGSLRGRVLAARCLEVSVCGMTQMTSSQLVGRTLQVLQPLLLHPEPLVWIHAARSFGRLAGIFEPLEGTLLDWVHGDSKVLQQRALTAFASLPSERLSVLGHELVSIIDAPGENARGLAAAAAATPHLFHEKRQVWDRLAARVSAGDGGAVAARALARGLGSLWRRGDDRQEIEGSLRRLRQRARRVATDDVDDWRRWLEVIAVTDPVDAAERDPLDVELGLENLLRLAAQYDDEEADARAARFASTLSPTFVEATRILLGDGSLRHRASAINALEGCARSLALRLWGPMLATRPGGSPIPPPDVRDTWELVARAPAELLDVVRERRHGGEAEVDPGFDLALEVLALKLGGYALDACGEDSDLGPGRGPTAHDTCLWLRKLEGLTDGSRDLPPALSAALSSIFWRLVDTTRGTALGEVDDVEWLGPFAAWWALVIDRPEMLLQLATALPMIADGALEKCCTLANETRAALAAGDANGLWGPAVMSALASLRAKDTELAASLAGFASALAGFSSAAGPNPKLESMSMSLVLASERLRAALADPVRALHTTAAVSADDSLERAATKNAPRMASVVARAIRAREITLLEVWFANLGPMASALVEAAIMGAIRKTPPPPPVPKRREPQTIQGYELVKPLGEGGIGSVWLVRKPGADRYFVLKIPKAEALQNATDTEREGILASFVSEARALAGLYHPNVANIIDRGVEGGVPFLVLEYLIGADLKDYSTARLMTLFELRQIVTETCAGLTALHNAGLVHRDIKPANLWLRLPLAGGVKFDPGKHRDPAHTQPLSSVVIDFGMVREMRVSAEVGGRFVAGTPGYIAPEQVLDPVELDGRADLYALVGTIYNVTTGRTFFDEVSDPRERILAHMRRDPMEDASRFSAFPANLVKLLRAGTAMNWKERPSPMEFGRAFTELF